MFFVFHDVLVLSISSRCRADGDYHSNGSAAFQMAWFVSLVGSGQECSPSRNSCMHSRSWDEGTDGRTFHETSVGISSVAVGVVGVALSCLALPLVLPCK